ncbi:MAG: hypothetical protein ACF8Q5_07710 [Phycisphaerales bacterium JB040]
MRPPGVMCGLCALAACVPAVSGEPFVFQGLLRDGGARASGAFDLRFELWDQGVGGSQAATLELADVPVVEGLFTVTLDFGAGFPNAETRWLEVQVSPDAPSVAYEALGERQYLAAAPFAAVDLGEPWQPAGGQRLAIFEDGVNKVALINRQNRIGSEYFGVGADTSTFAGMYTSTTEEIGRPFYGYAAGETIDAYHWYDGNIGSFRFWMNGVERFMINQSGDLLFGGNAQVNGALTALGDADVGGEVTADGYAYESDQARSMFVGPSEFALSRGLFMDQLIRSTSEVSLASGFGELIAMVSLPEGAQVQGVYFMGTDNSAANSWVFQTRKLTENGISNPTDLFLAATNTSTTSGNFERLVGVSQTFTGSDVLTLVAGSLGDFDSNLRFRGARVVYTVSRPD